MFCWCSDQHKNLNSNVTGHQHIGENIKFIGSDFLEMKDMTKASRYVDCFPGSVQDNLVKNVMYSNQNSVYS